MIIVYFIYQKLLSELFFFLRYPLFTSCYMGLINKMKIVKIKHHRHLQLKKEREVLDKRGRYIKV